jgi:hypothetical protein
LLKGWPNNVHQILLHTNINKSGALNSSTTFDYILCVLHIRGGIINRTQEFYLYTSFSVNCTIYLTQKTNCNEILILKYQYILVFFFYRFSFFKLNKNGLLNGYYGNCCYYYYYYYYYSKTVAMVVRLKWLFWFYRSWRIPYSNKQDLLKSFSGIALRVLWYCAIVVIVVLNDTEVIMFIMFNIIIILNLVCCGLISHCTHIMYVQWSKVPV